MNRYQTTFDTWNKIASLYEDVFMEMDLYDDTYTIFCKELVQKSPSIIEIGCGPGNITKHIISKRPDCSIFGIDIAPNMIKLAEKNNPSATFQVMDGRYIHTLESKFDGIVCGFYLPYVSKSDRSSFIKHSSNLLHNDGILYISFVEGNYKNSGYHTGSSGDQVYFYYHSLDDLKNELTEYNFTTIHIIRKKYPKKDGTVDTHTILMAKKCTIT